jgi:hypothetical protein
MSSTSRFWLFCAVVLLLGGGAFGYWWWGRDTAENQPSRPVAIVASADTGGWIVPCGCAANQSGGMMRRGTFLRDVQKNADILFLDAGGAPGGTSAYQKVKFEAILRGEKVMGIAAHNLGGPEAALGAEYLREVRAKLAVPFVSANLRDSKGELVAEPILFVERGGKRFAITGLLSRKFAVEGIRIDEPRETFLNFVKPKLGKHDVLVILAYLPEEELRQLAKDLPEAQLVLGGPAAQSIPPHQEGPTLLAGVTNKGKFLLHLEPSDGKGKRWQGKVVELGPQFADDDQQKDNLKRYLDLLEAKDFHAQETGFDRDGVGHLPADSRVAGNDACVKCHQDDCKQWKDSKHGHAWETLETRGYHVDSYCQKCHTNGYGLPGGFVSRRESLPLRLQGVGCESCHGPSQAHVRDPKQHTGYFHAKDRCATCHDPENSPGFNYDTYWERIRHGKSPGRNGTK